MEKVIVPLGSDCTIANFIRDVKKRESAFPFDWSVTYGSICDIFETNFNNFFDVIPATKINPLYAIYFMHDDVNDMSKYKRRIERLYDVLKGNNHVVFIRASHQDHHHKEIDEYSIQQDEIDDMQRLHDFIKKEYPNLSCEFHLFLRCSKCYESRKYECSSKIKLYNTVGQNHNNSIHLHLAALLYE